MTIALLCEIAKASFYQEAFLFGVGRWLAAAVVIDVYITANGC